MFSSLQWGQWCDLAERRPGFNYDDGDVDGDDGDYDDNKDGDNNYDDDHDGDDFFRKKMMMISVMVMITMMMMFFIRSLRCPPDFNSWNQTSHSWLVWNWRLWCGWYNWEQYQCHHQNTIIFIIKVVIIFIWRGTCVPVPERSLSVAQSVTSRVFKLLTSRNTC